MTLVDERWLLPVGVEETLPPLAAHLERSRRKVLDLFSGWGYELVIPPFIEHLEALLTGTGRDLERQTFTLVDQMSGRLIGVRADMTPQVARIDARHMAHKLPARLCYLGTVLRTRTDAMASSRSPVQVGAEIYGHGGIESDCEVMCLMMDMLRCLGIEQVHIDVGHVGIFRTLLKTACLDSHQERQLLDCMQRKAGDELESLLAAVAHAPTAASLRALIDLNGGEEVLAQAEELLAAAHEDVASALMDLKRLIACLRSRGIMAPVHLDLAELRGYHYHTGITFAAFVPNQGHEIARGGRYDDIGKVFGAARPATGFSADLKTLLALAGEAGIVPDQAAIIAPWDDDPQLHAKVAQLRACGMKVIQEFPGTPFGDDRVGQRRLQRGARRLGIGG